MGSFFYPGSQFMSSIRFMETDNLYLSPTEKEDIEQIAVWLNDEYFETHTENFLENVIKKDQYWANNDLLSGQIQRLTAFGTFSCFQQQGGFYTEK